MRQSQHIQSLEEFFVDELEYEAELRRRARKGDQVVTDLQMRGPLHMYVLDRQGEAIDALRQLVKIDPNDAANIGKLQARIEAFVDARSWIEAVAHQADEADAVLKGEEQGEPNGSAYVD